MCIILAHIERELLPRICRGLSGRERVCRGMRRASDADEIFAMRDCHCEIVAPGLPRVRALWLVELLLMSNRRLGDSSERECWTLDKEPTVGTVILRCGGP